MKEDARDSTLRFKVMPEKPDSRLRKRQTCPLMLGMSQGFKTHRSSPDQCRLRQPGFDFSQGRREPAGSDTRGTGGRAWLGVGTRGLYFLLFHHLAACDFGQVTCPL